LESADVRVLLFKGGGKFDTFEDMGKKVESAQQKKKGVVRLEKREGKS